VEQTEYRSARLPHRYNYLETCGADRFFVVVLQDDDSRQMGCHACGAGVHCDFACHFVCGSDLVDEQEALKRGFFA
jgi:hypothetical protein